MNDKHYKVLLVEDDADDIYLFREALKYHDYHCELHVVSDGSLLLDTLGSLSTLPDIMIMDLNMPKIASTAIISEMRQHERYGSIPIMVVSTSDLDADRMSTIDSGANMFFSKATSLQNYKPLVDAINRLCSNNG